MSAKVISFSGISQVSSDRKAEFLQHLSQAFDAYVEATGSEPPACIHALGGPTEPISFGWHMTGSAAGYADAVLARTSVALQAKLIAVR